MATSLDLDDALDQLSKLSIDSPSTDELDPAWLIPHPTKEGFVFRCALSLKDLISQRLSEIYFRRLLSIVEQEKGIVDFHLRIREENRTVLTVDIMFHQINRHTGPVSAPVCISCDTTNPLSQASLLQENSTLRIWLDAQLREKFVVTPIRHIERLSAMTKDEMNSFWNDTQAFLDQQGCTWQSMILNHGICRNHAHLHMKINIHPRTWHHQIRRKYSEKLRRMNEILNQSDSANTEKYFGKREFNQWSGIRPRLPPSFSKQRHPNQTLPK